MADERDFLDENGNDQRYGHYFDNVWLQDPPEIVEMKKSGDWYKMSPIQQRWKMRSYCKLDHDALQELFDSMRAIDRRYDEYHQANMMSGSSASKATITLKYPTPL
ncbi:MAG: hypothetical protein LBW85_12580 [Deltaproteobacteria bacterium]|jgi:hypothetical protein|nr:hypothetical protein [Deltaproteobacteria bacterium]